MEKKEAMKILKNFYYKSAPSSISTALDTIIPELKESEDEKIRKALLEYFNEQCDMSDWNGIYGYQVVDWLKKQSKPVEINLTEFNIRLQTLIEKFESLPKEELIESLSFWMNVVQNDGTYKPDEKQGDQKPAIEMKSAEESLCISPEEYNKIVNECIYGDDKSTWSKEDEQILNAVILHIKNETYNYYGGYSSNEIMQWLKSLKPQNNITAKEFDQAKKNAYNDVLDKIKYHSGEPTFNDTFDDGWSAAVDYIRKKFFRLKPKLRELNTFKVQRISKFIKLIIIVKIIENLFKFI